MAATQSDVRKLLRTNSSGKQSSFFSSGKKELESTEGRIQLAGLLSCAGFSRRAEAETIFKPHPVLLTACGSLTDNTKTTYPSISAFGYVVMKKDIFFIKKVADFLEVYEGEDKSELMQNLLAQFQEHFNEDLLKSVQNFISICKTLKELPSRNEEEIAQRDKFFIEEVGSAQTQFEAHILHLYCSGQMGLFGFDFKESGLPEDLSFLHFPLDGSVGKRSLNDLTPGPSDHFALVTKNRTVFGLSKTSYSQFFGGIGHFLQNDCNQLVTWDKELTSAMLKLKDRFELIAAQAAAPSAQSL